MNRANHFFRLLMPSLVLATVAACGSSRSSARPTPVPTPVHAPGPTTASSGTIDSETERCAALEAEVKMAADALAACKSDAECTIIDGPACDVDGLGCYWIAANRSRSPAGVLAAYERMERSGCPGADCDCAGPPETARCVSGRCRAL